jgi:hypothetical protein
MRKIKIGDVFSITTPKGKAYFQYVYDNKEICELIRVLPGIYTEAPFDLLRFVAEKEMYMVHFPLKAALKKGIIDFVGDFGLPKNFELPQIMRIDYSDAEGNQGWHIVNYNTWQRVYVKTLSREQLKLSPWEIWNDTMLIERLSDNWNLEQWV